MTDITQLTDEYLLTQATTHDPPVRVSKEKRVLYAIDNKGNNYTDGRVEIDCRSQFAGARNFASVKDGYLVVPYVVSLKGKGTGTVTQGFIDRMATALKAGVWNIVDSLEIQLGGKTIITEGDYKLYLNNLRAQTEWSASDVKHKSESMMFLDQWESIKCANVASAWGDGFSANKLDTTAKSKDIGLDHTLSYNEGYLDRALNNPPLVGRLNDDGTFKNGYTNKDWVSMNDASALEIVKSSAKGCFLTSDGVTESAERVLCMWVHMCKIRLQDLHPLFKELDLTQNLDMKLRIRFNAGWCDIKHESSEDIPIPADSYKMSLVSTNMTSGKTVPVMIAGVGPNEPLNNTFVHNKTIRLAFGPVENADVPYNISSQYMPFAQTRLYMPFYDLISPEAIISKPTKKVRFLDCYAQLFQGAAGVGVSTSRQGASFNLQLSATKPNIKAVAVVPYANTKTGYWANTSAAGTPQYQSPFDPAPAFCLPGSHLRNIQFQIGNQNCFAQTQEYDFNAFCDEFAKLGSINGDLSREISNGLIDYTTYSMANRIIIGDCSRITDAHVPQSILVSGTNDSTIANDLLVLVIHERSLTLNRLTGEVEEVSS